MKTKRVTIAEIAKKAGVSVSTVSYVLSRKRPISEDVRKRVLQTMHELNYRPNQLARSFKESRTWTIGLYTMTTRRMRDNNYFSSVLAGMLDYITPRGYTIRIISDDSSMEPDETSRLHALPLADGSVVFHQGRDELYRNFFEGSGQAYVFIGRPGVVSDAPHVTSDHYSIGLHGTALLIDGKYDRLVYVDSPQSERGTQDKTRGIQDALEQRGFPKDKMTSLVVSNFTIENGKAAADELLQDFEPRKGSLGVLSASHVISTGIYKRLRDRGVHVPEEVGIVSSGGEFLNELREEPFTALIMDPYRVGYEAGELLVTLIEEPDRNAASRLVPVKVVTGSTCGRG